MQAPVQHQDVEAVLRRLQDLIFNILIDEKITCMHGGLSPEISNTDQACRLVRPCTTSEKDIVKHQVSEGVRAATHHVREGDRHA